MAEVPLFPIQSPYTRALLAGGLAGTAVDVALFPLDTLKTRLQSQAGFLASGGFRGVYAGIGSAVVGAAPGAALFFVSYEGIKKAFRDARERRGGRAHEVGLDAPWMEPVEHMVAASTGEVAACAVRVPTEVIKQRAQARGWGITVVRELPFTMLQFPLWEGLKEWRRRTAMKESIEGWESGLAGSVSGAIAGAVTTPLDVLKTRLMLAREKVSAGQMAKRIVAESGWTAFFRGMGPRTLWIGIGGWIFLGSYQWALNSFVGMADDITAESSTS